MTIDAANCRERMASARGSEAVKLAGDIIVSVLARHAFEASCDGAASVDVRWEDCVRELAAMRTAFSRSTAGVSAVAWMARERALTIMRERGFSVTDGDAQIRVSWEAP